MCLCCKLCYLEESQGGMRGLIYAAVPRQGCPSLVFPLVHSWKVGKGHHSDDTSAAWPLASSPCFLPVAFCDALHLEK